MIKVIVFVMWLVAGLLNLNKSEYSKLEYYLVWFALMVYLLRDVILEFK